MGEGYIPSIGAIVVNLGDVVQAPASSTLFAGSASASRTLAMMK